ncbi:MAG: dTDP-glucose 4,6-dehydratase, partial [Gemmatimonadetes bacterium]|nr:dTDP-glucose 4,6-dehydratase [Gemmatimonadota bacterium]
VRQICQLMGRDFETSTRTVGERLGQDARYWLDSTRATRELGWAPAVPFEQGLREVVDWVEANWSVIQQEPLTYVHKA